MNASTTVITCIESGGLEQQVLLLVESLRTFGGRWANTPIMAIKPRTGPGISTKTKRALERMNVEFIDLPLNRKFDWWAHANKPASMAYAEIHAQTPCVTWMDGDMVVLREPDEFTPGPGKQFIARAGEAHDVASNGKDDGADFWHRICAELNIEFDSFPDITSFPDRKRIKAYWQTGLYTYPKNVGFGEIHMDTMAHLLNGTIASKKAGIYHTDQISAALAVQRAKLKHDEYQPNMNFNFNKLDPDLANILPINDVKILHYHGSFWPDAYQWASDGLRALPEDQKILISKYAPISAGSPIRRIHQKIFNHKRNKIRSNYEASVNLF